MASAAYYIGMDLGGSTFKALAVTPQGTVLRRTQGATLADAEPKTPCSRWMPLMRAN
jgi:predicted NBD/HSP70 family sugar kinase